MLAGWLLLTVLAQAPTDPGPPIAKKDRWLADKIHAAPLRPTPKPGDRAARPIWAHNLRTHEIRTLDGPTGLVDQEDRGEFFRCWFTAQRGPIPAELVERMIAAARHFEVREVRIISGYRAPKYNLSLRKKGREVAEQSEHSEGLAIDFFLPGVGTRELYDWALSEHEGGVGFYPVSEFVHIDRGRKRTWKGS